MDSEIPNDLPQNISHHLEALFNQTSPSTNQIIFSSSEQASIISFYIIVLLLGLIFNGAIIWVILGKLSYSDLAFIWPKYW